MACLGVAKSVSIATRKPVSIRGCNVVVYSLSCNFYSMFHLRSVYPATNDDDGDDDNDDDDSNFY